MVRKRKTKSSGAAVTLDLNMRLGDKSAIVPHDLVLDRVSKMDASTGDGENSEELIKKQKMTRSQDALSAAAVGGSPR